MTKAVTKSRDIVVVRQYTHKGISILVQVDRARKIMSFVEVSNGNNKWRYENKKWVFAERGPEYFNGWILILQAMEAAIKEVQKEFNDIKEAEFKSMVDMAVNLSKFKDKRV